MEIAKLFTEHLELIKTWKQSHGNLSKSKLYEVKVCWIDIVVGRKSDTHFDVLKTLCEDRVNYLSLETLFIAKGMIKICYILSSHSIKVLAFDKVVVYSWFYERSFRLLQIDVMLHTLFFILFKEACKITSLVQKEYLYDTINRHQCLHKLLYQKTVLRQSLKVPIVSFGCIINYILSKLVETLHNYLHLFSIPLLKHNFPILKSISLGHYISFCCIFLKYFGQHTLCLIYFLIFLLHKHKELADAIIWLFRVERLKLLNGKRDSQIV